MSDGIEHGTQGTGYAAGAAIGGSAAQAAEASHTASHAASQTNGAAVAAPATTATPAATGKRNGKAGSKAKSTRTATVTTPANSRTIAITLPNDVADWYDQQAAQAPFEPSTQKYVAWQLREWMKNSKAEAEADRAMIEEAQQ